MATISKRVQDLESKTNGPGKVLLTIIRKILNPNHPNGGQGPWAAKFDAQSLPELADNEVFSNPGETEEHFRARVQEMANKHRKKGQPVRLFLTSLDAEL